ncbi:glycoside hydrolase [Stieleria sp. JC731]|uniref:sialidase family protein n=1 Tax=Pirellulaceae TaxID=2691357 RepID=UPI001E4AECD0|nr:sialidase family protein [Stieleria sp. JC731]MCC9602734.1 glycoside hydrolase [Stieleria sp. JC731]
MKYLSETICLALLGLICTCSTLFAAHPTVNVFQEGESGYKVFRIPAVIKASNGHLLAFCEARQGGDASEIDLVQKRSTDGGKSWSDIEVIQESDDFKSYFKGDEPQITIGNPAPVVDHLDKEHVGRIWMPFTLENDRVFVIYSDDNGQSWSERREITADVKLEQWGWYATGPVQSIQIQHGPNRGRIVVPADHRLGDDGEDRGALGAHLIYSDDHGQSWKIGAVDDDYEDGMDSNETTVVELGDGTLYINTRDQNGKAPGTRGEAWSHDGGKSFVSQDATYKHFRPVADVLDPPVVQCSLIAVGQNKIVFCGPDSNGPTGKGRSDLRLRYSNDETESWVDGPMIHVGPAAYSGMVSIDDDHLGVIYEAGEKNPYQSIKFSIVDVGSLR